MDMIWIALMWVLVVPFCLSLGYFSLEVWSGLKRLPREDASDAPVRSAILVPAHNEALHVAQTIAGLQSVAPAETRLLVVADNCTDDTAAVARAAGAEVIERHDTTKRGKGYALAFGRDWLARNPPDVVLVVDADCVLLPGSVEALGRAALTNGAPAQAVNIQTADRDLPPLLQISGFALMVKNLVRLRGLSRIGGCSLLCGTGMAFPWHQFAAAKLATGNVVEDLGLAVEMIRQGIRPHLVEDAHVRSAAASTSDSVAQRSRWEHGFMATARKLGMPTLAQGLASGNRAVTALGLHLLVPPLALLIGLALVAALCVSAAAWLTGYWPPAIILTIFIGCAGIAVILAWLREGRHIIAPTALLRAPLYILWKVPIYARALLSPQAHWNRTKRAGEK